MKAVKNLDELVSLVGKPVVEKCFTEYLMTVIAMAKRMEALQDHCATMDEEELDEFVNCIERRELLEDIHEHPGKIPGYFIAVQAALAAVGYDEQWVAQDVADALKRKYIR